MIDGKVALEIFECGGPLCGRLVWVKKARDRHGRPIRDRKNPDPALRQRPVCGLTVVWGLQPSGPGQWRNGAIYNPRDGRTYHVNAERVSDGLISARIHVGVPFIGITKSLVRVERRTSDGWC